MFDRIQQHLIDDWKSCHKLWSVRLNALGLVLMGAGEMLRDNWSMLPPSLVDHMPHAEAIGLVIFALGIVARLAKQAK